ncbi:hypothetical protein HY251_00645 [bacterium]|nr:hypothetical protein [bacterium]
MEPTEARASSHPGPTQGSNAATPAPEAPAAGQSPVTLTEATARDLEAALEDSGRPRAQAGRNGAGSPDDLLARRIVLKRDRWEALLKLTQALEAERGVVATPAEVAAIVLDAGLNVILEEARERPRDIESAPRRDRRKTRRKTLERSPHASAEVKAEQRSQARAARTHARRAPASAPLAEVSSRKLTAEEEAQLRSIVAGLRSQRSVQRAVGLWLGSHVAPGTAPRAAIAVEDLRSLCRALGVYCTDNFAQNMKKDHAFFTEVRDPGSGERLGYGLTPEGAQAAARLTVTA